VRVLEQPKDPPVAHPDDRRRLLPLSNGDDFDPRLVSPAVREERDDLDVVARGRRTAEQAGGDHRPDRRERRSGMEDSLVHA
jgi:hypothetical protein